MERTVKTAKEKPGNPPEVKLQEKLYVRKDENISTLAKMEKLKRYKLKPTPVLVINRLNRLLILEKLRLRPISTLGFISRELIGWLEKLWPDNNNARADAIAGQWNLLTQTK